MPIPLGYRGRWYLRSGREFQKAKRRKRVTRDMSTLKNSMLELAAKFDNYNTGLIKSFMFGLNKTEIKTMTDILSRYKFRDSHDDIIIFGKNSEYKPNITFYPDYLKSPVLLLRIPNPPHNNRFSKEGRESADDGKRSGRLQTSRTTENIEKVSVAVRKNRLQAKAESVGISSVTCECILAEDLKMHRVCQHIVSLILNEDQSANEVKSASQVEFENMDKNRFQKCFDDFYKPWQKYVFTRASYFEGGCVSVV
ncbi:hypothetical protein TNCV_4107141 [Trichonephila clavipes]|nr:hypothetical protein TNCV_4107141 [Trichonephila clavipes]